MLNDLRSDIPLIEKADLIEATFVAPYSAKIHNAVQDLLEHNPADEVWAFTLIPTEQHCARRDRLAEHWLELNMRNPDLRVSGIAAATRSKTIIELIYKWLKKNQNADEFEVSLTLETLFRTCLRHHKELAPKVFSLSRAWVLKHGGTQSARVRRTLVEYTENRADLRNALNWYHENRELSGSWPVLAGFLDRAIRNHESGLNPSVFEQCAWLMREGPVEERVPAMALKLLQVTTNPETIKWAKETYARWESEQLLEVLNNLFA
jgi:hypothetical protein